MDQDITTRAATGTTTEQRESTVTLLKARVPAATWRCFSSALVNAADEIGEREVNSVLTILRAFRCNGTPSRRWR